MDFDTKFNKEFKALEQREKENKRLKDVKELMPPPNPPTEKELERLYEYYPSFKEEHRLSLLSGMFIQNSSVEEILDAKLEAKGIDKNLCSNRSLNMHRQWVFSKGKKAIILMIYLRYRIDGKLTRNEALKQINSSKYKHNFGFKESESGDNSIIRKITNYEKSEEKLNKL